MVTSATSFESNGVASIGSSDGGDGPVIIPDAQFLFHADFTKTGSDLTLVGSDGQRLVILGYFNTDRPADLFAPDGAMLSGETITTLAKSHAPLQYAQAGPPTAAAAPQIGSVDKVSGGVTVIRNGASVALNAGDQILKGDVILTGTGASVAIMFVDGTALNLGANTRMVMNEFVFDPNSTTNSSVLSLVTGSFVFVSGEIAKTGGLNFETPVATMGIRGTTGGGACATSCEFYASQDFRDGHSSEYTLTYNGIAIGTVRVENNTIVGPSGPGQAPVVTFAPAGNNPTLSALGQQLAAAYPQMFVPPPPTSAPGQTTPQGGGNNGSSTPQNLLLQNDHPQAPLVVVPPVTETVAIIQPSPAAAPVTITVVFTQPPPSNLPPVFNIPIANQVSDAHHTFNFTLPAGTFSDPDTAVLTVTATLADGSPLPNWLSFDPATQTFSGTAPPDANGVVPLQIIVSDGTSSVANFFTLTVVNNAPVVTTANPSATIFTENQAPRVVDAGVTVSDVDSTNLAGATVTIAAGFQPGDTLTIDGATSGSVVVGGHTIQFSYDANTHVLSLSGAATPADYQAVLRTVSFFNAGDNVSNSTRTITFQVDDGSAESHASQDAPATIVVNHSPVAAADSTAVTADAASTVVSGNVLANDTDIDSADTHTVSAVAGATDDGATFTRIGTYGTLVIDKATGAYTYTLANGQANVQALTLGQTVTDVFNYTNSDNHGGSGSSTLTITVNGANDAAVISGTTSGAVTEAGGVNNGLPGTPTATGTLTDTDVDNPANTFQAVTTATASDQGFGRYTMTAGGVWTYTLDNSNPAVQALNAGDHPTDTFTVHSADGTAQQIMVTINGANDAAVISGTTSGAVTEAGGVNNGLPGTPTATGTLTDTDVDNPANTFQAVTTATASDQGFGRYTMTAGGVWTYTLDNSNPAVQALNAGDHPTDTFTVHSADGTAQQIMVTINGANDAAVISGTTSGAVTEAGGVNNGLPGTPTATGTLTDTDVDNPANTFQAVTTATASDQGFGRYTMTAGGVWTYTLDNSNPAVQALNAGDHPTDTFTVHSADGTAQQIMVTINGANDAAVISGTTSGAVTEAGGVNNGLPGTPTATGTLTDTDVDNPANTFQAVTTATASDQGFGRYTMTAGGVWTYTLDNSNPAVQALNAGDHPTDTFTVHSADGTAQQIMVTINGANDAAVISGTTSGAVTEAGGVNNGLPGTPTATGTLTDTDVDNPANTFQAVTTATASDQGFGRYTMTAGGVWTYTLDNNNATVQALNAGDHPTDTFTVHSADGTAQQITVTINGANDAAVISGTTSGAVTEAGGVNSEPPIFGASIFAATIVGDGPPGPSSTATGTLTDTDVDNPANTFQAVTTATASDQGFGRYTMTAGGVWTYTLDNSNPAVQALNAGDHPTDTFTVRSADGTAQQITVTINGANDAAVISGTTSGSVIEAGGVNNGLPGTPTATGTLTDTDVDNPANTFQAVTTATASDQGFGRYTMTAGGVWTYTLDNNNATVQALNAGDHPTDTFTVHSADGTAQQITVTINGANDAAVISGTTSGAVTEAGGVNSEPPIFGASIFAATIVGDGPPGPSSTATGTLTDTDVDNPANTFQAVTTATASDQGFGRYTMTAGGVWTYTLDNSNPAVQALNAGDHPTDTFTVRSADGTAQQITVTINGANDAAVISGTTSGSVIEAGGVNNGLPGTPTATGTLTDTDVDNPANTFQAVTTATASDQGFGRYTMTAGGVWTYTLDNNNATVQALNAGDHPTDTFTVHSADGTAQQITVTINGANDAAVISGTTSGAVTEAGGVNSEPPIFGASIFAATIVGDGPPGPSSTATGTLTDTDVDNPANTFQAVTTATASDQGFGRYTMTAGGVWTYTLDNSNPAVQALNAGDHPTDTFTVRSADGTPQQITITINGADNAPVLGDVAPTASYSELAPPVILSPGLTASDVDNTLLAFATVSISSGFLAGDVLAATTTTDITASYNSSIGVLSLSGSDTLAHYQQVLDSVTYSSTSDNLTDFGNDTSRTITWVVNDGTLDSTAQTTTINVTPVNHAVAHNDSLGVPGEGFAFNAANGQYYLINTSTLSWTAAQAAAEGFSGYLATVTSAQENSFIYSLLVATFGQGVAAWLGGSDAALEGDWRWVGNSPEAGQQFWQGGVNGSASMFVNWAFGEPNNAGIENYLQMTATGLWNDLAQDRPLFSVNEFHVSVIEFYGFQENHVRTFSTGLLLANDTDVDGNTLVVSGVTPTADTHGTVFLNLQNGTITYTPEANFNGLAGFDYIVSDGHGGTSTATASITVTPVNDAPVFTASDSTGSSGGTGQNLVINGGFESDGSFSGWTLSGNTDFTFVSSSGSHSGNYNAQLGPVGSDGHLTENIATVPGQHYTLDFWLEHDGGAHNDFSVTWNGATLLSYADAGSQGYTEHTFDVVATDTSSALQFTFRQDPAYWHLDDASVTASATASGTLSFTDADTSDTHTATFAPLNGGNGYIGTFTLSPASDVTHSVAWNFSAASTTVNELAAATTQSYAVSINDGHSGITTQTVSTTIGTSQADNFGFQAGIGSDIILNFSTTADHVELDGFSSIHSTNDLAALLSENSHHDAVINLGHGDSITFAGVTSTQLQSHWNNFSVHDILVA